MLKNLVKKHAQEEHLCEIILKLAKWIRRRSDVI